MKKVLVLVLMVALCSAVSAQSYKSPQERLLDKQLEYAVFDELQKQTLYNAVTTAGITPTDKVATSTAASYYLPDSVVYPIKLRVQNHGNGTISYTNYALTEGTLVLPNVTATAPALLTPQGTLAKSGLAYEGIFYSNPGLTFASASGTQAIIIEVWGRSNE